MSDGLPHVLHIILFGARSADRRRDGPFPLQEPRLLNASDNVHALLIKDGSVTAGRPLLRAMRIQVIILIRQNPARLMSTVTLPQRHANA